MMRSRSDKPQRRNDYNISCPKCGQPGMLANRSSLVHYRCFQCGARYQIEPKKCRACGEWISDDAEYCEWHSTHGFEDKKQESFVPKGVCLRCKKRRSHDIYEYCKQCMDAEGIEYRDWDGGDVDESLVDLV